MKKLLAVTALFFALGAATATATADADLQTWCNGFADSNGVPRAPCVCIVAAIGDSATLKTEMMTMQTIAQYHETGSPALKEKVDPCVPAGQ